MTRQTRPGPGGSRRVRLDALRARLWRDALEPRLLILRQLPAMGRPLLTAMIVINIVLGLVPMRKYAQVGARIAGIHRHSDYLRNLALSPRSGKEIRVFGLIDWLADRYEARYRDWLRPQARARRDIYIRPYLWYTAVGLAVTITVYLVTARSAATGGVSLTQLAIVLQATVTALMLGEHYPESDQATQQGMLAVRGLDTLQRVAAEHHGGTADRRPVTSEAGMSPPAATEAPKVRFERMSFHYPGSNRVVHDSSSSPSTPRQPRRSEWPAWRTRSVPATPSPGGPAPGYCGGPRYGPPRSGSPVRSSSPRATSVPSCWCSATRFRAGGASATSSSSCRSQLSSTARWPPL